MTTKLCTCDMPFCNLQHAPLALVPFDQITEWIDAPADYSDWEGPALPEYSERDEEAALEMLRDDMMLGAFGL